MMQVQPKASAYSIRTSGTGMVFQSHPQTEALEVALFTYVSAR